MQKRGQIALFLITGVLLLLALGILFSLHRPAPEVMPAVVSFDSVVTSTKAYVSSCLDNGLKEAVGLNGIGVEKTQLVKSDLESGVLRCVQEFSGPQQGYKVEFGSPNTQLEYSSSQISANLNLPVRVSGDEKEASFSEFSDSYKLAENARIPVDSNCRSTEDAALSIENEAALSIKKGTELRNCNPSSGFVDLSMRKVPTNFNHLSNHNMVGSKVYRIEPAGITFSSPASFELPLNELAGYRPSKIKAAVYNEKAKLWEPVKTFVDYKRGLIVGELPHLSYVSFQDSFLKEDAIVRTGWIYRYPAEGDLISACSSRLSPNQRSCATATFKFTIKPSSLIARNGENLIYGIEPTLTEGARITGVRLNGEAAEIDNGELKSSNYAGGLNTLEFELQNNGEGCCGLSLKFSASGMSEDFLDYYDYHLYNEYTVEKLVQPSEASPGSQPDAITASAVYTPRTTIQQRINTLMCPDYPLLENCMSLKQLSTSSNAAYSEVMWLVERRGGNYGDPGYKGDSIYLDELEGYANAKSTPAQAYSQTVDVEQAPSPEAQAAGCTPYTCRAEGRYCDWCAIKGKGYGPEAEWFRATDCSKQYGGDESATCECGDGRHICKKQGEEDKTIKYDECTGASPDRMVCSKFWPNTLIRCTNKDGYGAIAQICDSPCVEGTCSFTPQPTCKKADDIGKCRSEGRYCDWCANQGSEYQWTRTTDCAGQFSGDSNAVCNCNDEDTRIRPIRKLVTHACSLGDQTKKVKYDECNGASVGSVKCSSYWPDRLIRCRSPEGYGEVIQVCEGKCQKGGQGEPDLCPKPKPGCNSASDLGKCSEEGRYCSWCAKKDQGFEWATSTDCNQLLSKPGTSSCACDQKGHACTLAYETGGTGIVATEKKYASFSQCRGIDKGTSVCANDWSVECTNPGEALGIVREVCTSGCRAGSCIRRAAQNCVRPTRGMTITRDTVLCEGTYSLPSPRSAALIVKANGVTLDCNGAKLAGGPEIPSSRERLYAGTAILLDKVSGVTVKNCDISHYKWGIEAKGGGENTIRDNTLNYNYDDTCTGQEVVVVLDRDYFNSQVPEAAESYGCGKIPNYFLQLKPKCTAEGEKPEYCKKLIYATPGKDSLSLGTALPGMQGDNLEIGYGNSGFLGTPRDGYKFEMQDGGGIRLDGSVRNRIFGNKMQHNSKGMLMLNSNGNIIANNDMDWNTIAGIHMVSSKENTISYNELSHIRRYAGPDTWAYALAGADSSGILAEDGSDMNRIMYNNMDYDGDGLFFRNWCRVDASDSNLVQGNKARYPVTNGIEAGFSWNNVYRDNHVVGGIAGIWVGFEVNDQIVNNYIGKQWIYGGLTDRFRGDAISAEFVNAKGCGFYTKECSPDAAKFLIQGNTIESPNTDGISVGFYSDDAFDLSTERYIKHDNPNDDQGYWADFGGYFELEGNQLVLTADPLESKDPLVKGEPDLVRGNPNEMLEPRSKRLVVDLCRAARYEDGRKGELEKYNKKYGYAFHVGDYQAPPPDTVKVDINRNTITGAGRSGIRLGKVAESAVVNNEFSNNGLKYPDQGGDIVTIVASVNNDITANTFCKPGKCENYYIRNAQKHDISVKKPVFPEPISIAYTKVYDKSKDPNLGKVELA